MENNKSFIGDSLNHDMEYIGAPGGSEDNGATASYGSIFKDNILYNTLKSFTPPVVDENFLLHEGKLFNLKDYYNHMFGKYETSNPIRTGGQSYPIFYTPEDAEKFLKRVK